VHRVDTSGLPIGQALKVERTIAGVTLTRIATAVGVSIGQLSRIESGERTASAELVERIRVAIRAATETAA
jgi:transcriptional regulator with XRE-family HTH domain